MRAYTTNTYSVSFETPAFLAGANQQKAEWRTPPFKDLIREWWRIVKAPEVDYNVNGLRESENRLFGHAATSQGEVSGQSQVRLRLEQWRAGTETDVPGPPLREQKINIGGFLSPAALYLGYGPIQKNESRPAISNSNDSNKLTVSVSNESSKEEVWRAIQLAAWFGSVGSRSRNSWGSLSISCISGQEIKSASEMSSNTLGNFLRDWEDCLKLDWPHAIGKDTKGPLIWKTTPNSNWGQVIKDIAKLRYDVRQLFPLDLGSPNLQERHILAYPIKEPVVRVWGKTSRFPNQLRLKIIREGARFHGIITHIPCALPKEMAHKVEVSEPAVDLKAMQLRVWTKVHQYLDEQSSNLTRVV